MRKLSILLLIIVLLLCMFASCQQPDVPPVDGSDSDSGTESESETETEPLPDGSIVITPAEWDSELKKLLDSFVTGEFGEVDSMSKNFYASYQSSFVPVKSVTDAEKIAKNVEALKDSVGIFTKPVSVETIVNGEPTNMFHSPLGVYFWRFRFDRYYLEVLFFQAPPIQTGNTDAYFISLAVSPRPNLLYNTPIVIGPGEDYPQYTTMFQVTKEQYKALLLNDE